MVQDAPLVLVVQHNMTIAIGYYLKNIQWQFARTTWWFSVKVDLSSFSIWTKSHLELIHFSKERSKDKCFVFETKNDTFIW